ncbi:DUF2262 domain-containing protein [Pelomonas sp. V22]|uniref:DUF2262 domain-containing protein n=1 Tax=Pelomonas sp. V22 TaxID=2822139 RepID=UPI0024A8D306|nr:DUF2262 domain-containing protein [Pelomonas sp. V22]MDI4635956.1 DUF2262 domain-containing protein [Pelomonas sp. V22]
MNFGRRLFQALARPQMQKDIASQAMEVIDPVVGRLSGTSAELHGIINAGLGELKLVVWPDGQPMEASIQFAASFVQHLSALNLRCQEYATKQLLPVYNDSWRTGAQTLTPREFCSMLQLSDVEITGVELATLRYECGDLFGGHGVSVTSFDGVSFHELQAEL